MPKNTKFPESTTDVLNNRSRRRIVRKITFNQQSVEAIWHQKNSQNIFKYWVKLGANPNCPVPISFARSSKK